MTLSPGVRIGAYEVTAPIGAGGMGEVCAAGALFEPRVSPECKRVVLQTTDGDVTPINASTAVASVEGGRT